MENFFDYRLFRIGQAEVTVASLLIALAILAVSFYAARLSRTFIAQRLLGRTHLDTGLRYAIGRILGYVVFFFGALVALQTIGIDATMLAVFGGALGIGIGFGLQDIVKNFVAGLILLLERHIAVGDRIQVGEVQGDVKDIRARATIVRTNDEVDLIVPNSRLINDTVINWSHGTRRVRYRIPVGVAYGSDLRAVREALLEAAGRSEHVLKEPPSQVWLTGFGDSSLEFEVLCWTTAMLHNPGAFENEINLLIHEALAARGIEIPFPQRDLRIRSAEGLRSVLGGARSEDPARKLQFSEAGGEQHE